MRGVSSLLSINLSGKVVSIVVFAFLARTLDPEHLAYIGLIPAIAALLLAALGGGIGTLLERDFPRLRTLDPAQADILLRSGFLVASMSIPLMLLVFWMFGDSLTRIVLAEYTFNADSIHWITLPIAFYMFSEINGWVLIVRGEVRNFGIVGVYGDISAKLAVLAIYLWRPSESSVFLGLALGRMPFLAASMWWHRRWLASGPIGSPFALIWKARLFFIESVFNAFRGRGDSLMVSSILGPVAMANYYVAQTVAVQLRVFYSPVTSVVIPMFSARFGNGKDELARAFGKVWSIATPLFIWLAAGVAAVSPFLLALIAGPAYADNWRTALILCFVAAGLGLYGLCSRILLIIGSSVERFRVVLIHTALIAGLMVLIRDHFGSNGIAFAWLLATVITIAVIRQRAIYLGFNWPASKTVWKAVLLCVPVPIISLFWLGYGDYPDWAYLSAVGGLSSTSLLFVFWFQNRAEERAMLETMPSLLLPAYQLIRRFSRRD